MSQGTTYCLMTAHFFSWTSSAPPGFHAAAAVIPTPSMSTFDQPLSEAPSSGPSSAALCMDNLHILPLAFSNDILVDVDDVEWQDYTHPPRWLPTPCAVYAHDTTAHLLTTEYPLDDDLTLLQNPSLPAETLPTTYNLEAYDGAILCPERLIDGTRKSIMRMCAPCRKTFGDFRQPLDAMANFQYYAHDELPAPVKAAFDGASMYDIMMVARLRATRITHLFKKAGRLSASFEPDELVMEAVGYTIGQWTPQDARNMKASAVAWCLDKKQFIKMQSGSKFNAASNHPPKGRLQDNLTYIGAASVATLFTNPWRLCAFTSFVICASGLICLDDALELDLFDAIARGLIAP
ncbi:hypothetical protein C8J57DRAFT_1604712 [Mycena rebaudengoi]|nr:hypothetical protein C8J57DRAFT_1604712 [Mycena rebaudengoi]